VARCHRAREGRCERPPTGKKTAAGFWFTLCIKRIILPRQAWDKHRKALAKGPFSCSTGGWRCLRRLKRRVKLLQSWRRVRRW
jgi:hypothetical protein